MSPSGSPHPFYAEFGWLAAVRHDCQAAGRKHALDPAGLRPAYRRATPGPLVYDNGEGLEFRRTISVDDKYMFTVRDEVANKGSTAVALHPFGLISRHGTPKLEGYLVSHEGFVGVLADKVQEEKYADVEKKKSIDFQNTQGWLGITDKYWATTLIPESECQDQRPFPVRPARRAQDLSDRLFSRDRHSVAPGGSADVTTRLFAGAKEVALIDGYNNALKLDRFDQLIDWGYFYFITKPLFLAMDWIYHRGRQLRHRHPAHHRPHQDSSSSRSPTSPTPRWRR